MSKKKDTQVERLEQMVAWLDKQSSKRMASVLKDFKSGSKRTEKKLRKMLLVIDTGTVAKIMLEALKDADENGD